MGAVGTIMLATAVFLTVTTTRHLTVTTITASGLFAFTLNLSRMDFLVEQTII